MGAVRILGLPFSYFKECTLNNIGNLLGTVVKIDKLTLAQARGKFGRLCIEIDLQKPLRPYVEVDGLAYSVVYEGISMICFNCGCYGHVKANCSMLNGSSDTTTNTDDIQMNMGAMFVLIPMTLLLHPHLLLFQSLLLIL